MPVAESSMLWRLARSGQPIDAKTFAAALSREADGDALDFRTELLMRDGLNALAGWWGRQATKEWVADQSSAARLQQIWTNTEPPGFPTLGDRIMDETKPDDVLAFFRELGSRANRPAVLHVGGSTSLILAGLVARQTDDVDVVNEVPADLREQHEMLAELAGAYGLKLTHFQSHYLPSGWQQRVRSLGRFGKLDVFLVDVYDVLAGKLTSSRRKDRDDLRAVATSIDKSQLIGRLQTAGAAFLADAKLAENARQNWYIVYGEAIPKL